MATESYKITIDELLKNYLNFRKNLSEQGLDKIELSFKDYVSNYVELLKSGEIDDYDDDEEDYLDDQED